MANDEVAIRVRVIGDEAARTLHELGRQLQELGEGEPAAAAPGGGQPSPAAAPGRRDEAEDLAATVRDLVGLARLIAERIDQQRQALEALVEAIDGEEEYGA
jgi:hypothetical protein